MSNYGGMLPDGIHETITNAMIPTIKLSEFTQGFWYAFTGRIKDTEETHRITTFWIQRVAGNASTSVDVVNDVTGEKIARIPPMLSSGNTSNLVELFGDIKKAREMSKLDNPLVSKQRLDATKKLIMKRYESSYLKESVSEWIILYNLIEGGVPTVDGLDVPADESPSTPDLTSMEWV